MSSIVVYYIIHWINLFQWICQWTLDYIYICWILSSTTLLLFLMNYYKIIFYKLIYKILFILLLSSNVTCFQVTTNQTKFKHNLKVFFILRQIANFFYHYIIIRTRCSISQSFLTWKVWYAIYVATEILEIKTNHFWPYVTYFWWCYIIRIHIYLIISAINILSIIEI